MATPTYTFIWRKPASEVYVSGTFDNWSKSAKLVQMPDGTFSAEVDMPFLKTADKVLYKFVVDGEWIVDPSEPIEKDAAGIENNVLDSEAIAAALYIAAQKPDPNAPAEDEPKAVPFTPTAADVPETTAATALFAQSAAPTATTAELAKDVPLEKTAETTDAPAAILPVTPVETAQPVDAVDAVDPAVSAAVLSSAAPVSTTSELVKDVPLEKPAPAADAPSETPAASSTSETLAPVAAVAAGAAAVGAAVTAAAKDTVETAETPAMASTDLPGTFPETPAAELDKEVKLINPLPAAPGGINPIQLAPGEPVPESLKNADLTANVKLDAASYEQADAAIAGGFAGATVASLPPVSKNMIPESSLPITGADDVHISSAAPVASTAVLAGAVPLEAKTAAETPETPESPAATVPAIVQESQKEAGVAPEASANPEAVQEKEQVEEELLAKVPEAAVTSEGAADSSAGATTAGLVGGLAAAAAGLGAAAYATASSAKDKAVEQATPAVQQAAARANEAALNLPVSVKQALPVAVQEKIATTAATHGAPVTTDIPDEVKHAFEVSGASPEAAANPEAVAEKKEVESELLAKVHKPEAEAAPAPTAPTAPEHVVAAPEPVVAAPEPVVAAPPVAVASAPVSVPEAAHIVPGDGSVSNGVPAVVSAPSTAPAGSASTAEKKKKNRLSSFFHKIFDGKKK